MKFLSEKQKKTYQSIVTEKNGYEQSTKDLRLLWEKCWKLWTQKVLESEQPFKSRKRLPKARNAVNTFASFLVAKEPTFNVLPTGDGDELKAQFIRELLQYQARRKNILDLKHQIKVGVKSATLFGLGLWKVYWMTELNEKKQVIFDDPQLEAVNILDFFANPYINSVQRQKSVVQQFTISIADLRSNPNYKIPTEWDPQFTDSDDGHYDSNRLNKYDLNVDNLGNSDTGMVTVWEYWTKAKVITIADPYGEPIFLREMKNPYGFIPFVKMDFEKEPIPNRFYGSGAIGPNYAVSMSMDEMLNNIMDNVRNLINPMFLRRKGSSVDPRQFVSRPAGFIDVDDMNNDVKQLNTYDTTERGYKLFGLLSGEFQQGTRISLLRAGNATEAGSATEAQIEDKNSDVQTNSVKENLQDAIAEIGEMVAKLNVQNMQRTHNIRIFNVDLVEQLHKGTNDIALDAKERQMVAETGMYYGFGLTPQQREAAVTQGVIPAQEFTLEDKDRIKRFGKVLRFGPQYIDVPVDIEVEADSTMNKDTTITLKKVDDFVNTVARTPDGVGRIDWATYAKIHADLSGIPDMNKLIVKQSERAPIPPQQTPTGTPGPRPGTVPPQVGQLNTPMAIRQSVMQSV